MKRTYLLLAVGSLLALGTAPAAEPVCMSGIYPHLAYFNNEGECGTGAVVPWADRLWVITYGPHLPCGSSDKLYEITPDLQSVVRPESVGGTPANRMIHRESNQLFIGPYAIDADRNIRVIPPSVMPGRLTGNARHLTDPANKIYFATMEKGLYSVDVRTLEVWGKIKDINPPKKGVKLAEAHPATVNSTLIGWHGKGLYSGQGAVYFSNNGERGKLAETDPDSSAGALAQWRGTGDWDLIRRNQFTEITGPGGIYGNEHPDTDPVWAVGWDKRSLILMLLDGGRWHAYRLPKASHTYDGAHGWHTEWPRIREIGENDLLMTMHGMFWRFPKTFSAANSAGIAPRSTYLKVIGDFCRWNDRIVLGCDDSAKSQFLNMRKARGHLAPPGQSQSNLWFVEPSRLDQLGAPLGRGAVWLNDAVKADQPSDPYLFSGFDRRGVHLAHTAEAAVTFTFEVDLQGNGQWTKLREVDVPAKGYAWVEFPASDKGAWVRVRANRDCPQATAYFQYAGNEPQRPMPAGLFDGLARAGEDKPAKGALLLLRGDNKRTLAVAADAGYYELDGQLTLRRVDDPPVEEATKKKAAIPQDVLTAEAASILYVDEEGKRWRLPKGEIGQGRIDREVSTERDLFNCGGTFYELPANSSGGFGKIRPVCTHNLKIKDYASCRGLFVIAGVSGDGPHIVRSDDGKAALWAGAFDDLWMMGKPRGQGGPWKDSAVKAGAPSDPYLMTGYDKKSLLLTADRPVTIRLEVDITGAGQWYAYREFAVEPGKKVEFPFPDAFNAYWARLTADKDCAATAIFTYE